MPHPNARIPDFWPTGKAWTFARPDQPIDVSMDEAVEKWGDHIAVTYNGADYTYRDIAARVDALAGYLQHVGLTKGDRVLLYTQNCPQYIISFFAILRAGGAVVPVNPMNKQAEIDYLVADTGAKIAICALELSKHILPSLRRGGLSTLIGTRMTDMGQDDFDLIPPNLARAMSEQDAAGLGITGFQSALDAGHVPAPRNTNSDDLAVVPYSSGTTGQPKGCMHTHRTFLASLYASVIWNPPHEDTVHLAALPFFHVTGMVGGMCAPILTGGRNVILPRWSSKLAAGLIKQYKISRWRSIATMAIDLVNDPDFDSYDLSTLEMIGGGGAAMPDAIAKRLKDMTGLDYIEGYGLSETMAATHINPIDAPKRQCLGQPIYEVDSRVLEIGGDTELPHGEVGEIVMHAPQNFTGYWQRSEATNEAFVEINGVPFFRSGDIGYRDAEGYFFMVDRVKRMVNAAGFKVWPAEIEMLMLHHPEIAECCVIGAKDDRRGECVKAFVVPQAEARDTLNEDTIIQWCKTQMSAYKCPTIVEFIDALPKSGVGKVLWKELS